MLRQKILVWYRGLVMHGPMIGGTSVHVNKDKM